MRSSVSTNFLAGFGGQALVTCPRCREWYSGEDRKPYILSACRHKICEQCLEISDKCPTCRCVIKTKTNLAVDLILMKKAEANRPRDVTKKQTMGGGLGCPKCGESKVSFRMMCPHCNCLMCKSCVMNDIEVYLPQLERAFRRYQEILEKADEEVERHLEEERLRIDQYYAEKARQLKNQLQSNAQAMEITDKIRKVEGLIQQLSSINTHMDTDSPKIEDIEHSFEVIVEARRIQKNERTLNIGENSIQLDRFDENQRLSKFIKMLPTESALDQSNEDAFRELFAATPQMPKAIRKTGSIASLGSMGSRLNIYDGAATRRSPLLSTPEQRARRFGSPDSRLERSGQFSGFNKL